MIGLLRAVMLSSVSMVVVSPLVGCTSEQPDWPDGVWKGVLLEESAVDAAGTTHRGLGLLAAYGPRTYSVYATGEVFPPGKVMSGYLFRLADRDGVLFASTELAAGDMVAVSGERSRVPIVARDAQGIRRPLQLTKMGNHPGIGSPREIDRIEVWKIRKIDSLDQRGPNGWHERPRK